MSAQPNGNTDDERQAAAVDLALDSLETEADRLCQERGERRALVRCDWDGVVTSAEGMRALFGWDDGWLVGQYLTRLVRPEPDFRQECPDYVRLSRLLAEGAIPAYTCVAPLRRADGSYDLCSLRVERDRDQAGAAVGYAVRYVHIDLLQ